MPYAGACERWCARVTLASEAGGVVEKKLSPGGIPNKILDGAPQGARRFGFCLPPRPRAGRFTPRLLLAARGASYVGSALGSLLCTLLANRRASRPESRSDIHAETRTTRNPNGDGAGP